LPAPIGAASTIGWRGRASSPCDPSGRWR